MNPLEPLAGIFVQTFRVVVEASPFVLLGLLVAGMLHEFFDTSRIVAALGGRDLRSILAATFLGAPLPLCSCGVLPAALSLHKKGASREATIAFLISTPETGVDSIALTYGLLGPFMALARPVAAIATGIVAGLLSLMQPELSGDASEGSASRPHNHSHEVPPKRGKDQPKALKLRLKSAVRYGLVTLLDDLAFWFAVSFVVTGVLSATLSPDFFQRYLPSGFLSLVVMAILGVPTYVCASASTTVVAAMMAKGLNPGAALVFMLTGPATNASTVGVIARLFGRRFIATYLGAIFTVAIAAGMVVNVLVGSGWAPPMASTPGTAILWPWLQTACGLAVVVLMGQSLMRTGVRPGLEEVRGHLRALWDWTKETNWRQAATGRNLRIAAVVLSVLFVSRGVVVVGPGEEGLVRTFGRASDVRLQPGLHVWWPPPLGQIDVVAREAVRTVELGYLSLPDRGPRPSLPASFPTLAPVFGGSQTSRIPEGSLFVTGDETIVAVTAVIQYQIADAARYQLGVDRPDAVIRDTARAALIEVIGRTPIDALYSNARGQVEADVLTRLRRSSTIDAIGVRPLSLNLLYVHAPDEVHAAFRDVASAAEDSTTTRNKALVEAEGSVRLARGEAARTAAEAESYRIQQMERAHGNAAAFVPLAVEDQRASAVTRDRLYIEAMERVLAKRGKLIKPNARRVPGLELWVTPADSAPAAAGPPFGVGAPPGSQRARSDDGEFAQPNPAPTPRP